MDETTRLEAFRKIVELAPEALIWTDREGRFTWINPAGVRLFGHHAPDEIIGTEAKRVYVNPGARDRMVRKLMQDGIIRNFIALMKRKDKPPWYAEITCVAVKNEQGEFNGLIGVCRDVTDRLRLAEKLDALREFHRTILNTIPTIIITLDPDKRITAANDAACRLLATPRGELIGTVLGRDAPETLFTLDPSCSEVIRTSIFKTASAVPFPSEGKTRFIDVTILPLHKEGETIGAIIEGSDVTDHVLLLRWQTRSTE